MPTAMPQNEASDPDRERSQGVASAFVPPRAHGRFGYSAIVDRPHYRWPNGAGLAVYLGFNVEHFAFGEGLGAELAPSREGVDVLNYSWREYGNRVGVWRCLAEFDRLALPTAAMVNTALLDHCPQVVDALAARGDELIAHGHTNADAQGAWDEPRERALLRHCRERLRQRTGTAPRGWLSPWIAESALTSDLLVEEGYRYTLNWCHDDQPTRLATRTGEALWSIPYPQELNDIPAIAARRLDVASFARMIVDNLDELLHDAESAPRVMGIALHPYLIGQPYRLRAIRAALEHVAQARDRGSIWMTTPGAIFEHVQSQDAAVAS